MNPGRRIDASEQGEGNAHLVRVLMYHRIVRDELLCRATWSCVHVDDFRKQLGLLDRRGFTTITFDDYRLFCDGALNLPRKPVILTFDDGYLDTYQQAFPVLYEFGMKAVVFVLGNRKLKSNIWDRHVPGISEAPLMEAHHIVDLHETGFEIGAHSMTHANLLSLSEEDAREEIAQSKQELERLLNAPVRSFAYPYGFVDARIKRLVERAGYAIAYSTGTGPATFGEDPYETRRTTIRNTTGAMEFGLKALAGFPLYEWTRWQARKAYYAVGGKQRRPRPERTTAPPGR